MGANGPSGLMLKNCNEWFATGIEGWDLGRSKPVIGLIGHGQRQIEPGFQ